MAQERVDERLFITRQQKIEYLVERAYFNKVRDKWASGPRMFREELQDQSDHVVEILYRSAIEVDKKRWKEL